jgi:hypothetical protein
VRCLHRSVLRKEGMLVWSVREGSWKGVDLKGLNVLAVVKTTETLGNVKYQPRSGDTVLIVDEKATARQREALRDFARDMAGSLIGKVVDVKTAPIEARMATCEKAGCASVKAGELVEITTSCMGNKHHLCGNEEVYYEPLSKVDGAYPVFTEVASYKGDGLGCTWQIAGNRGAFLATFAANSPKSQQLAQK